MTAVNVTAVNVTAVNMTAVNSTAARTAWRVVTVAVVSPQLQFF
jgi:hypothetical protein